MPAPHPKLTRCAGVMGVLTLFCALSYSQQSTPVALVIESKNANIRRANFQSVVPVYPGDLVFPGDMLLGGNEAIKLSFCPTNSSYSFLVREIKVERARLTPNGQSKLLETQPLPFCRLPSIKLETQRDLHTAADRLQTATTSLDPAQSTPKLQITPEQRAKLEPLSAAVNKDPRNLTTKLALAITLEEVGDYNRSIAEYQSLGRLAPGASWIADEMRQVAAQRDRVYSGNGKVIGVVVGISEYKLLSSDSQLQFADKDASDFYDYLISKRGGARPADVALLLNERARLGDIRVALGYAFAQATPADTVIVFVAGHGIAQNEGPNAGAYILAYESNLEDLPDTALRMEELQELTNGKLRPHQVRLFVDACHSGLIGAIQNHRFNLFMRQLLNEDRPVIQIFGLLASKSRQSSFECSNFEHGAFTYFLLRGLNTTTTDAVDERSGRITVDSLTYYVQQHVRVATAAKQFPEQRGNMADRVELANKDAEGSSLFLDDGVQKVKLDSCESLRGRNLPRATDSRKTTVSDPFSAALEKGLLLPGVEGSAYDMLSEMRGTLSASGYLELRNRLLAHLENAGQEILLHYLRGEAIQMTREEFVRGEQFFAAAATLLSGGDSFVESRRLFCKGRALIFEHNLPQAISTLREAIRLDTLGAYSYNALGIAFLESAAYRESVSAFQDAIRLAPFWAYARHNLALALTQDGQYNPAIASYRAAMQLGPQYFYIPYNLGLLYERLNRPQEARDAWRQSLNVNPRLARAWNAIGLSYFLERRFDKAEQSYQEALAHADNEPDLLAIRHNLALLRNERRQFDEAVQLWRLNLADKPNDLPSLIGLSDALASRGQTEDALATFSALLQEKPDYTGARLKYARLLIKAGKAKDAVTQITSVLHSSPESSEANEMMGDLAATPLEFYKRALENATSGEARSRIRKKMQELGNRRLQ